MLTVLVVLGGCGGEESPPRATAENSTAPGRHVEVTNLTVGRGIGPDFRVLQETTTFRPLDTVFVSVGTLGTGSSAALAARWTDPDGRVVEQQVKEIAPVGAEATEFHLDRGGGWPPGDYEVVITLDGEEVARASFRILDRP